MPHDTPFPGSSDTLAQDRLFEEQVTQVLAATMLVPAGKRAADLPAVSQLMQSILAHCHRMHAQEVHLDTDVSVGLTQIVMRRDGALTPFAWLPTRLRDPLIDHLLTLAGLSPREWPAPQNVALRLPEPPRWCLTVVPTGEGLRDVILRRSCD